MPVKGEVRRHWETETAGIRYGEGPDAAEFYHSIEERRYALEPYIPTFAQFELYAGKRVLEIGVGGGVDFSRFVRRGALATGVDLTAAGIAYTGQRLKVLESQIDNYGLVLADAEDLPFADDTFDLVYSWGVLHHTPDTTRAFTETLRVLKAGSTLRAMVYHTPSWTGWMLWIRHALLRGRPYVSPRRCIYQYLESPGTKVYTVSEIKQMLQIMGFVDIQTETRLGPGDLLTIKPSQRYRGVLYGAVWLLYPRWLVRLLGDRFGLAMLVTATKPTLDANSATMVAT